MRDLEVTPFDDTESILYKKNKVQERTDNLKRFLFEDEIDTLFDIYKNFIELMPEESFSGKRGRLLYEFKHEDSDREVYISPEIYLVQNGMIVYEVYNREKYFKVSKNPIYISHIDKTFCEIPLIDILKYVSLEDIINFLTNHFNKHYKELKNLEKRFDFLQKIKEEKKQLGE